MRRSSLVPFALSLSKGRLSLPKPCAGARGRFDKLTPFDKLRTIGRFDKLSANGVGRCALFNIMPKNAATTANQGALETKA